LAARRLWGQRHRRANWDDGWEAALKPVVAQYSGKVSRIYSHAGTGFVRRPIISAKPIKIGEKVLNHGHYSAFQMAEVAKPLRRHPAAHRRIAAAAQSTGCVTYSVVMRSTQTHGKNAF
jgi:hypothetical protein